MERDPKASVKDRNRNKLTDSALICFVENGIDHTKVSDIASRVGLTERTAFRYFETKDDLVLATLLRYWEYVKATVRTESFSPGYDKLTGIEQLKSVLYHYSDIYLENQKELIFIHEAETYLYRAGKYKEIINQNIVPFDNKSGPLSQAIKKGILDGTIRRDLDIELLYFNTFDSLLGLLQKIAIYEENTEEYHLYGTKRLRNFCDLLISAYSTQ